MEVGLDTSLVTNSILEDEHSVIQPDTQSSQQQEHHCRCGVSPDNRGFGDAGKELPEGLFDCMPGGGGQTKPCAKCTGFPHAGQTLCGVEIHGGNTQHHHHHKWNVATIGDKELARSHHLWLIYNEDILRGYRINYHSWKLLFKSAVSCHNETTNFWSHFVGVFIFSVFLVFFSAYYMPLDIKLNIVESAREFGTNPRLVVSEYFQTAIDKIYASAWDFNTTTSLSETNKSLSLLSQGHYSISSTLESMRSMEAELKGILSKIDMNSVESYT
jgi:hypothetical protein